MTFRRLPHLADRADIIRWAERVDARSEFPRLIRGLIKANNDQVIALQMRAAEGVDAPGYDGISDALRATPFVPKGSTVWELGVGGDPGDKAQRDYRSRTDDPLGVSIPDTTFVFVTPREWRDKDTWAQRKRDEGRWADVRAFDVDDIEQALELAPAVHHRFSELAGKPSHGATSIDRWWEKFRRLSSPMLDPEMVLAGRADDAAQLLRIFDTDPCQTSVAAVSADEVIAFVAATILSADSDVQEDLLSRALIVKDTYTLAALDHYDGLLILIPYEDDLRREARLVANHHVVVRADDGWDPTIDLPPVDPAAFQALLEARAVQRERAQEHARFARRSIEAFQRAASVPGVERSPAWAERLTTPVARRAWLVGKWSERRSGDLDALADLFGLPYELAREELATLSVGADPLFVVVGETWAVVSLEDAWRYGQPQLQPPDLAAFEILIQNVLGAVDPRLELPVEERWMAAVRGKVQVHSSDLRDGVAGVLALLGARGDEVGIGSGTVGSWLRRTMWHLFKRANEDPSGQLWASLTDVMPLLAEAVPDVFLDAAQKGLEGEQPLLGLMFADNVGDALTVSSPHTGLLWALENVAWSPEHFSLAIEQLARLAEVDPGGRLSNRPAASLADIFRSWLPQTSVPLDRRLAVLDGVRARHPTVSWPLMLTMLPESHAVGSFSHSPRYRDWKPPETGNYDAERYESFDAAGTRLVADGDMDPDRWAELASRFADLPPSVFDAAIEALEALPADDAGAQVRARVWEPLRALVQRHQRYAHADWAMPPERTERLDALQRALAPDDIGYRIEWLFDDHMPDLPEEAGQDFEPSRYYEAVAHRRRDAIAELIAADGLDGVIALSRSADYPGFIGTAVADAQADAVGHALLEFIDGDDRKLIDVAYAWAARKGADDPVWLAEAVAEFASRPVAQARLLLVSNDLQLAWALADRDEAVADAYWLEFSPYGRGQGFELANEASRRLLAHDRPRAALALMNLYGRSGLVDPALVVDGLEAFMRQPADHPDQFHIDGHDIEQLLEIARTADVPRERLGQLEWTLRPALGYGAHSPVLEQQLAADPEFFVQVLSMVFKPRNADVGEEVPEHLARNAYQLLDDWNVVPGSLDDGVAIDPVVLNTWVDEALRLAGEADRLEIALDQIGKVLAKAPGDTDGSWPAAPVREVIERIGRSELDDGFRVQILNSRGVQSRGFAEGGDRERERAAHYNQLAELVTDVSPRTAAALRSVAASYAADARYFDEQVERLSEGLER
jgi:hypothetical protein